MNFFKRLFSRSSLELQINDMIRHDYEITFSSIYKSKSNLNQIEDIKYIEQVIQNDINQEILQYNIDNNSILYSKAFFKKYGYYRSYSNIEYLYNIYKSKFKQITLSNIDFYNLIMNEDPNRFIFYNKTITVCI